MTSRLALSLLLAAASAIALNWGFFTQHEQAAKLPPLRLRHPLRSLWILFSNPAWLLGFLVGIGGWALYVAALAFGPLSLVQAVSAGGIGILALLVWRIGGVRLSNREWLGVACSVGGLVLLGVSLIGQGGNAHHWGTKGSWIAIALWMAASAILAGIAAGPGRRLFASGAGLGIAAGFFYAAGDVGTKAAVAGGARLAFIPAVLAAHGLAFILLQLGFQRGGALATAGVATLFTNAVPIAAGMALFHESLPSGPLGALRILSFAAVITGAVLLTRPQTEAEDKPTTTETDHAPATKRSTHERATIVAGRWLKRWSPPLFTGKMRIETSPAHHSQGSASALCVPFGGRLSCSALVEPPVEKRRTHSAVAGQGALICWRASGLTGARSRGARGSGLLRFLP